MTGLPLADLTPTRQADVLAVNACALTWNRFDQGAVTAGPQLGHFTLTRPNPGKPGYLIDGMRPC